MNKFEDHWRKKIDDPGGQKDFLNEKVRADMWKNILASKNGFEQDWQKQGDDIEAWEGTLTEAERNALWHRLQTSAAPFEQQWREKMEEGSQENGSFLDEVTKARIAATVFVEKENFELDWQDKINDPVLAGPALLDTASKNRMWHKVQSGNINTIPAPKEKRRPLFVLRWSHAAALLIGAFSTWLIWSRSSTPLQNALVVSPQPELIAPVVSPAEMPEDIIPSSPKEPANIGQEGVTPQPVTKVIAKSKVMVTRENRDRVERVAGKAIPVKPLQAAIVQAKSSPVVNTGKIIAPQEKAGAVVPEQDIEVAITKTAPAKKVVHISDIRPAAAPVKGTAIYGRAFGEGREKRNERGSMTFNSVLKNYK